MRRVVVIHCHIFKNAGTTLDWVLRRNFGERFVDHRDDDAMRRGAPYLHTYIENQPELKAISSHHVRLPLPDVPNTILLPAFILRHPLDRVESVYRFERKQKAKTPGAKHAKKYSFKDYVAWRLNREVGATIRNYQVRCCSGYHKPGDPGAVELEKAIDSLERSPLVGVVEQFDESMVVMEQALRTYYESFDSAYLRQNSGDRADAGLSSRIRQIEHRLGEPLMEELRCANELDLELHAAAKRILRRRVQRVIDFEGRLSDHRNRCKRLATGAGTAVGS